MGLAWTWEAAISLPVFAAGLLLSLFIWARAVGSGFGPARRLAIALALTSAAALLGRIAASQTERVDAAAWSGARDIVSLPLPFAYLWLIATLDTPIVGWLRTRAASFLLLAGALGMVATRIVFSDAFGDPERVIHDNAWFHRWSFADDAPLLEATEPIDYFVIGVRIFALVAAVSAHRRATAPRARRQSLLYALAFGIFDASSVVGFALTILWAGAGPLGPYFAPPSGGFWIWSTVLRNLVVSIAFVALLAYAILRYQLFDIDLRIRRGVSRALLAGVFVAVFFVVATVAESYMTSAYGYLAGGAAAGLLLFALAPLQRAADRVASRTMPGATGTPEYVAYRKLEVYRAAVESALETGGIDARERALLDQLRAKLGVAQADAAALETDARAAAPR